MAKFCVGEEEFVFCSKLNETMTVVVGRAAFLSERAKDMWGVNFWVVRCLGVGVYSDDYDGGRGLLEEGFL